MRSLEETEILPKWKDKKDTVGREREFLGRMNYQGIYKHYNITEVVGNEPGKIG